MTTQHTPTPWQVDIRSGCVAIYPASDEYRCLDLPPTTFVAYWNGRRTEDGMAWQMDPIHEANAAFIVKACNAHERLMRLADNVKYAISGCLNKDGSWGDMPASYKRELLEQARAALAAAEAK